MFKRRKPLTILQKCREFFWPSMGWKRSISHLKHRVLRLSDTPRNITLGLAIGAGVSFSPIMFTHFIQGAILAFILRANIPAAIIGTAVGNPWTFPFIWWASLELGSEIFKFLGLPTKSYIPDDVSISLLWDMLLNDPLRLLMPWLLGGYILCVIVIAGLYPIYLSFIKGAQRARSAMLKRKAIKEQKK